MTEGAIEQVQVEQVEITCERGLGRMLDGRCAGRWREANGKVPGTSAAQLFKLQGSKCAGCPHGKRRADEGCHARREPSGQPRKQRQWSDEEKLPPVQEVKGRGGRAKLFERQQQQPAKPAKLEPGERLSLDEVRSRLLARVVTKPPAPRAATTILPPPPEDLDESDEQLEPDPEATDAETTEDEPQQPQQQEEQPTMSERENIKCVACGGRFNAKPTGKIPKRCLDCRGVSGPPDPVPRSNVARSSGKRAAPAALTVTEPTPALAGALGGDGVLPSAGWPYAVSVRGIPVACRSADDVLALIDRFGAQL